MALTHLKLSGIWINRLHGAIIMAYIAIHNYDEIYNSTVTSLCIIKENASVLACLTSDEWIEADVNCHYTNNFV